MPVNGQLEMCQPLGNWSSMAEEPWHLHQGLGVSICLFWGLPACLGWDGESDTCGGKVGNKKKASVKNRTPKVIARRLNARYFNWMRTLD